MPLPGYRALAAWRWRHSRHQHGDDLFPDARYRRSIHGGWRRWQLHMANASSSGGGLLSVEIIYQQASDTGLKHIKKWHQRGIAGNAHRGYKKRWRPIAVLCLIKPSRLNRFLR